MKYIDWIKERMEGKLTPAELQAFDHELAENEQLRKEWETWQVTEASIAFSARHFPHSQTNSMKNNGSIRRWASFAIALFFLMGILLIVNSKLFEINRTPDPILKEGEAEPSNPPVIAESGSAGLNKEDPKDLPASESLESQLLMADTIEKMKSKKLIESPVKKPKPKPAQVDTEIASVDSDSGKKSEEDKVIEIDYPIADGAELTLSSTKGIILKPGFYVKPGTKFSASIVSQ